MQKYKVKVTIMTMRRRIRRRGMVIGGTMMIGMRGM